MIDSSLAGAVEMGAKAVIVGAGYVGGRLAADLVSRGHPVVAARRSAQLQGKATEAVQLDLDQASEDARLDCKDCVVFYFVPPQRQGTNDARLQAFFTFVLQGSPSKFVLISTTGVYGDCGGKWVDEAARLRPSTDQARRRVDSERLCRQWSQAAGVDCVVLRVPAIYGPGRIPIRRLKDGLILPPREQCGYTNRIHVDDLVQVCRLAGESDASGVINVSDGRPMRMIDYFELVAQIWGLPKPKTSRSATGDVGEQMAAYLRDSRKICNAKMLDALKPNLIYADLKQGLSMCYDFEQSQIQQ